MGRGSYDDPPWGIRVCVLCHGTGHDGPNVELWDRKGNVQHNAVDQFSEARAQMKQIEKEHDAKSPFQREVEKFGQRECRHCGWLCMPNDEPAKTFYPLEPQAAQQQAEPKDERGIPMEVLRVTYAPDMSPEEFARMWPEFKAWQKDKQQANPPKQTSDAGGKPAEQQAGPWADEFHRGVREAFNYLMMAAANTDDDRRSEILSDMASDLLEYLSPADHTTWKTGNQMYQEGVKEGERRVAQSGRLAAVAEDRDAVRMRFLIEGNHALISCICHDPVEHYEWSVTGSASGWHKTQREAIDDAMGCAAATRQEVTK